MDPYFLLLQMNDSLFPIGAYSHSYGLETYIQRDIVHDTKTAKTYIEKRLKYNFLYADLLAAALSYDAAAKKDLETVCRIEDSMEASRVPREIREASAKLGNRFMKTVSLFREIRENAFFCEFVRARASSTTCHPVTYGLLCACAGISKEKCLMNYLYSQASQMVTTCVKAIPISQSDGQRILYELEPLFHDILAKIAGLTEDDLCRSTPGFDLRSIEHERLYSRLYMS
ncbi:MAG: urease accessory protein UreF [Lachnospiraceae bacterium]|nr:urease accessory protein UreF [Lachnospiraceae bacterium]